MPQTRQLGRRRRLAFGAIAVGALLAGLLSASRAVPASATSARRTEARPIAPPALGDLLTYGYDNGRSGRDPVDPRIATLSAAPAWNDDSLDGAVYGQPLVYDSRAYVATEDDSVYAIDARTGKVLWRVHVGTPVGLSVVDSAPTLDSGCGDINPLGITGTPVIDAATNEIFVAEETELAGADDWQHVRHWLVAISLTSHRELWHRDIDPPHGNDPHYYYIPAEQQRPAITLAGGRLYVGLGGLNGDCGQYHGYVVELSEAGTGPLRSYQVPTQREGAIWETDGAMVSPQGDLYVATGNGSSNSLQDFDEGNAVVELSPALGRLGVWAPSNWVQLNDEDWDLGSSGPIQVPGTTMLFVAGKPASDGSFGYLMAEGRLGGIGRGAYTGRVCTSGGAFGADASDVLGTGSAARTLIFAPCGGGTEAIEVSTSSMRFHQLWTVSTGAPDGSPIVAGGVVWALAFDSGRLYGMNPQNGHVFVERATDPLDHFVAPAVGDGMLLVPTAGGVEAFRTIS